MTDTALLRQDFAKLRAQLAAITAITAIAKEGDGGAAPAGGPDASDVHVPAPLGAKGKKLKDRLQALHERLDKALMVNRESLRRHARKKAERMEARRRAAAERAKLAVKPK